MPIYEYRCDSCGTKFEKIQKFADVPLVVHEDGCGGHVERLISSPAFHFKGTGWYVTDYAKTNGQSPPAKEGGESKDDKSGEKADKKEAADKKAESTDHKKSEGKSESAPAPVAPAATPAPAATTSDKK